MAGRISAVLGVAAALGVACSAPLPEGLGAKEGRLADCPSSPNCVSTDASEDGKRTAPFILAVPVSDAWPQVREAVAALEGAVIVEEDEGYLRAECTSPLMRYVDDLEVMLQPERARLGVRSASRSGYYDMGANRERVWLLRRELAERGVVPR